MTEILLTTAVGVSILGMLFLFFTWIGRHSKKRAAKKFNDRFQYLDDYYNYYNESEETSEKQMQG